MLNSGNVELLDSPRLLAQILGLERRVARGGQDSIDHAPGSHDDVANAAAGEPVADGADGQGVVLDAAVESRLQCLCKLGLMICRCKRH